MLLAIAMLIVLSGAILVSISSQREKARTTRMLTEISSAIQPIYMCVSDGGGVNVPNSGGNVCDLSPNYGKWPPLQPNFGYSSGGNFGNDDWYIRVSSADSAICCNSNLSSCQVLDNIGSACNSTTP